jgi:hypothetical protein
MNWMDKSKIMSYSESEATLLLFSSNRDALEEFNSGVKQQMNKKGGQYDGPMAFPVVKPDELIAFLYHINDPNTERTPSRDELSGWLFDAIDSKPNLDAVITAAKQGNALLTRQYRILGDELIKSALSFDLPNSVNAAVKVGQRKHHKGSGHDPYTWNPNVDHIPSHPDGW